MGHPNHCWPLPSKFWKPSKNHWFQWLGPQKTFNGDGPMLSKPSKNHWSQWWPKKNINHSLALKNWPLLWSTADIGYIEMILWGWVSLCWPALEWGWTRWNLLAAVKEKKLGRETDFNSNLGRKPPKSQTNITNTNYSLCSTFRFQWSYIESRSIDTVEYLE